MSHRIARRQMPWIVGAAMMIAASSPAAATCSDVHQLLSQGLSVGQVAAALGASVRAVQACLQPISVPAPPSRVVSNPAGPSPFGAAGPPPFGAAGPAPLGAAGPPPLGAAGPSPFRGAGPSAAASSPGTTKTAR